MRAGVTATSASTAGCRPGVHAPRRPSRRVAATMTSSRGCAETGGAVSCRRVDDVQSCVPLPRRRERRLRRSRRSERRPLRQRARRRSAEVEQLGVSLARTPRRQEQALGRGLRLRRTQQSVPTRHRRSRRLDRRHLSCELSRSPGGRITTEMRQLAAMTSRGFMASLSASRNAGHDPKRRVTVDAGGQSAAVLGLRVAFQSLLRGIRPWTSR